MAKVEMDLAELDLIRKDLADTKLLVSEKEAIIKSKDEEIVVVKADKRTVRIKETLVNKPRAVYQDSHWGYKKETHSDLVQVIQHILKSSRGWGMAEEIANAILSRGWKHENEIPNINAEVVTSTEYINFDDVVSDIQKKQEQKTGTEIDGYKKTISSLQSTITDFQIKEEKRVKALEEHYQKQAEDKALDYFKWKKAAEESYKTLSQEFEDYKLDKKRISAEQRVAELERLLAEEKSRTWWQKLFNQY